MNENKQPTPAIGLRSKQSQINLQKLENAIRQALPELMELTDGCEVLIGGLTYEIGVNAKVNWPNKNEIFITNLEQDIWINQFLIIGHPITILHLLMWLNLNPEIIPYINGEGFLSNRMIIEIDICKLDLSKIYLRDQAQIVIDELVKLV